MSIGYSENSKTYLLINCASRKIKIRHDVIFDEGAKMIGFESNMSQDNEKIIGAMEVNRNAILYNLLKDNIKITYVGNIQQSAPNFNLHLEKMDTLSHGGHNDNIQGVEIDQLLEGEGELTNDDLLSPRNNIMARRMDLPLKEPFIQLKSATQSIDNDFICMVININEAFMLSKALQGESKM